MHRDINEINQLLDELSLGLVMVDPEDLIALGEVLEKVEKLTTSFAPWASIQADQILNGQRQALEAIILEKVRDKTAIMDLIGQGVSLLQEITRGHAGGALAAVDLSGFLARLKAEVWFDIGLPARSTSTEPKIETPVVPPSPVPPKETPETYQIDQDKDLFFSFINESLEHIETIEISIISLEQDPDDKDILNEVFRPFHTIKGVSGFLNLKEVHGLTHDVENLLDDARNDRLAVTPAMIDVILDAVDILKRMIFDLKLSFETGQAPPVDYGVPAFFERLKALQQGDLPEPAKLPFVSEYAGMKLGEILIDQGLVDEEELERLILSQEEARLRRLGEIVVEKGIISPEDLEEALRLQLADQDKKLGQILVETGKVDPDQISQAIRDQESLRERKLGEILIRERQAGAREVSGALREQKRAQEATGGAPVGRTVKVDTTKLDLLVDMVGELVIAQSLINSNKKVAALKDQKLSRDLSQMSRITSELQRAAMSMRMVPIRQTFQKMIRLVRDLSRKSGKLVDLVMSGEETEIDRNMVEAIYDPLVHMIRNSIDHGVELPAARKEKGKPAEGCIYLRAYHQGGNVVLEIEDDGRGLDPKRISTKAIQKGLIPAEESLSETAIFSLIFQPGFSTAEKVTDVSGRGVGMDVVKKAIDKMRGKIEVTSKLGKGAKVTIRLPLTLAIIDGMIVRVGSNRYILPTVAIQESFRPAREDYFTVKGQGEMIKVRQNLLPLVRLNQVLETQGAVDDPTKALIIVAESNGERRCLMVDEVLGKQEVVIKSLGERLKYVRALAGGSILGDGMVGLILDVTGVFEVSDGQIRRGIPRIEVKSDRSWEMDDDWDMGPT